MRKKIRSLGKDSFENLNILDALTIVMVLSALLVKVFYFQFTTQLNTRPFLKSMNSWMMVSNLGMALIIIAVVLFLFNRKKILGLLLLDLLVGVLLLSDTIYFRYYYSALSITTIYQLKLAGSIGDSIVSLFRIKN